MKNILKVKRNQDYSVDDLVAIMDYVSKLHLLLSELSQDTDCAEQYFILYKDEITIKSNICFDYINLVKKKLDVLHERAGN